MFNDKVLSQASAGNHRTRFLARLFLLFTLVPANVLAQGVPAPLQDHDGTVEVLHEDRNQGSRYVFFLRTATERLEMRFTGNHPALHTGDRVRARGRRANGVLALDSANNVQTLAAALPNTFGALKTLVILVNFFNNPTQPYSVAAAQNVFNATSNFDLENSYNQSWLTGVINPNVSADVVGWFTINQSSTVCNYSETATLADQAASGAGVNLANYQRRVYAFPNNGCSWWGLGMVGGNPSKSWINGSLQLAVVGHEMGHNLGLYHSHSLDCGATVLGSACTATEYGDYFDIMGSSSYHFNSFQKERLGWLNYNASPPITTVLTDGVYWISPYETDTDDPKALKILKSTDSITGKKSFYYLEARRSIGFDAGLAGNANIMNGVLVRSGSESSADSSYLLDMTPGTVSWSDPALTVGQTHSDAGAGVNFTVLSVDATGATVSVTFTPGGTATCVRGNPNLTLTPSNQTVAIGGSANYTVTVTNADSSACSASTFNLSSALPAGISGTFTSAALNLSPGASASSSLQVASSASASAGAYNFTVTGTNSSAATYFKTASGTQTLVGGLAVTAATDKPSYSRNQSVLVSATVQSNGAPMANVNVSFTITKTNGSVVSGSAITGTNGTAVYKYRVKSRDPLGVYQAKAVGTMSAVSGSATTTFSVQ